MPKRPDLPVYFTKLVLENIRSFSEQQELNLVANDGRPARWTLIVGDNGVGKTTLLQCLARMRPVFNYPPDDEKDKGPRPNRIEPELAREADNEVLKALARSGSDAHAQLRASLSVGVLLAPQEEFRPEHISTEISITRTAGHITDVTSGGKLPSVDFTQDVEEPLVLGYGAGRHPWVANADKYTTTDLIESLFKVEADLHDAEELLYQLDYSSLKDHPETKKQLDSLKNMLAEIVEDIENPQCIEILGRPRRTNDPPDQTGVIVKTPYGNVPLSQMSLGHQTVFAWTVDIAWRLLDHYPDSANPFHEPAIVIVDEIDLHLHPRWQRKIRERLTRHFPMVQFIATAHSPLMAQSSLDANLAVLQRSGDRTVILNDPMVVRGWRLDQLITSDLFDLNSARSPEVEKQQKRRTELIEKPKLSPDESTELAELDRMVLDLPTAETPEDQRAMEIIRRAAERLESDNESL